MFPIQTWVQINRSRDRGFEKPENIETNNSFKNSELLSTRYLNSQKMAELNS